MQDPPVGQSNGTVPRLGSPAQEGDRESVADLYWWQGVVQSPSITFLSSDYELDAALGQGTAE